MSLPIIVAGRLGQRHNLVKPKAARLWLARHLSGFCSA
jgi:hypothetical protein